MPLYTTFTDWQPDADDHFAPAVCCWCGQPDDAEEPCSPGCERRAVMAARMRRVRRAMEALDVATSLLVRYRAEGGIHDPRIPAVLDQIAEWERGIRVATEAAEASS
jgi:hypothetical protein